MLGYSSPNCKLRLAQLVEHSTVDRTVNGSIPLAEILISILIIVILIKYSIHLLRI